MVRQLSFNPRVHFTSSDRPTVRKEAPRPLYRGLLLMLVATGLIGLQVHRLVQLQLVKGAENRLRAEENRIRLIPVPSNRGRILDRNGTAIADNHQVRGVFFWPREKTPEQWKQAANQLSELLDVPVSSILNELERIGYQSATSVRISNNLTPEAFIWLAENAEKMSGVEIRMESSRHYPHGNLAAQVVGYIGEANLQELKANPDWPMGMVVGQLGIEALANKDLVGVWGARLVEVNAKNEELRIFGEKSSQGGTDVQLTIDINLQRVAEQALGQRRGAAVALNVKTGEVLAMASSPRFDPNLFTRPITPQQWEELQGLDHPFLNRALQGYPPGSTFKIVSSAAGMASGHFSPDSVIATSDSITIGGIAFKEHSGGLGIIGFRDALAFSSNTFFYRLGMAIGPGTMAKWARNLGIGTTDLRLLGLTEGSSGWVPTPEDKEKMFGEPWFLGDTVTMSIGQGSVLATPLELAVMVSAIANGGQRVKPHLLSSMTNTPATQPVPTGLAPDVIQKIREGLVATVQYGTAQVMNDGSIPLTGGKTGTSEVWGKRSHSVYVAFGAADQAEIAIAVVVENGGFGSKAAAPVALEMFQTHFAGKK
ncbi:penicillin-binding protein 2 [Limnospira maxima]|nr:penicillin-binding protein 2 [Limnospira maxima]MDC0839790.1 penicillin-binding protein 2 [Limnoraphis robusta]